ncbi:hypothetical protein C2G38_2085494 [Gigaspora rosea]|uniref:Uncharacterized protein n=1 Tax=Gigaspora rosea TaxID=44941 RepID=A0A397V9C0_9GLOM|nr:hypothetical protein C2G38_2085494 [Gigaspora rosea]
MWNRHQVVVKSGADIIVGVTIFVGFWVIVTWNWHQVSSVWRYLLVLGFVEVCCMYLLCQALFFSFSRDRF